MVIIYINFVEFEFQLLHDRFQDHRTSGPGEEDFIGFHNMHGGHLGM